MRSMSPWGWACVGLLAPCAVAARLDLRDAVVVVRAGELPEAEKTAATVLVEELSKRSGIRLPLAAAIPPARPFIAITAQNAGQAARAEG